MTDVSEEASYFPFTSLQALMQGCPAFARERHNYNSLTHSLTVSDHVTYVGYLW